MTTKSKSFIDEGDMERMRKAEIEHPATEHTSAGGWCRHCGCGNNVLGYKHLPNCRFRPDVSSPKESRP